MVSFALQAEDVHHAVFDPATWACNINAALKQLADLHIEVMQKKAGEADPQRRVYGPSMSAKVSFPPVLSTWDSLLSSWQGLIHMLQAVSKMQKTQGLASHHCMISLCVLYMTECHRG